MGTLPCRSKRLLLRECLFLPVACSYYNTSPRVLHVKVLAERDRWGRLWGVWQVVKPPWPLKPPQISSNTLKYFLDYRRLLTTFNQAIEVTLASRSRSGNRQHPFFLVDPLWKLLSSQAGDAFGNLPTAGWWNWIFLACLFYFHRFTKNTHVCSLLSCLFLKRGRVSHTDSNSQYDHRGHTYQQCYRSSLLFLPSPWHCVCETTSLSSMWRANESSSGFCRTNPLAFQFICPMKFDRVYPLFNGIRDFSMPPKLVPTNFLCCKFPCQLCLATGRRPGFFSRVLTSRGGAHSASLSPPKGRENLKLP